MPTWRERERREREERRERRERGGGRGRGRERERGRREGERKREAGGREREREGERERISPLASFRKLNADQHILKQSKITSSSTKVQVNDILFIKHYLQLLMADK